MTHKLNNHLCEILIPDYVIYIKSMYSFNNANH